MIESKSIETKDQLIIHLTKLAAANKKSYKFCGRINTGLQITAALAIVPAVPISVAVARAVPSVITILINKLKV